MPENTTCGCLNKKIVHVMDTVALVVVMLVQAAILNYFLISSSPDRPHDGHYAWIVADIICAVVFIVTFVKAYYHMYSVKVEIDQETKTRFQALREKAGSMPYAFISWAFYATIVLGKILSIVALRIDNALFLQRFSSHALIITVAISMLVFLLLVEGHNCADRKSEQHAFISTLTIKTCLEILDCISILGIVVENKLNYDPAPDTPLRTIIIVFFAITFYLPALALYKLSLSDFALKRFSVPLVLVYHLLHLFLVDCAFLFLRVFLWLMHDIKSSVLLVKNVAALFFSAKTIYPDVRDLVRARRKRRHDKDVSEMVAVGDNQNVECGITVSQIQSNEEQTKSRN